MTSSLPGLLRKIEQAFNPPQSEPEEAVEQLWVNPLVREVLTAKQWLYDNGVSEEQVLQVFREADREGRQTGHTWLDMLHIIVNRRARRHPDWRNFSGDWVELTRRLKG